MMQHLIDHNNGIVGLRRINAASFAATELLIGQWRGDRGWGGVKKKKTLHLSSVMTTFAHRIKKKNRNIFINKNPTF